MIFLSILTVSELRNKTHRIKCPVCIGAGLVFIEGPVYGFNMNESNVSLDFQFSAASRKHG